MARIATRVLAVTGTMLVVLAVFLMAASSAYAEEHVTLTVDNGSLDGSVSIDCVAGKSDAAESIRAGYLATLDYDKESGSYSLNGEVLFAIAARPASSYTDEGDLRFESIFCDGWLDEYNWGVVEADGMFYAIWESDFGNDPARLHHHVWKYNDFNNLAIKKASFTEGGYAYNECALCNRQEYAMPWPRVDTCKLAATSFAYTGKAQKPEVTVSSADGPLASENYSITYSKNTNVGTATAKVTLKGKYYEGTKTLTFKITKVSNAAKAAKKSVKKAFKAVKLKKKALKVTLPKVKTKFGKAAWKVVQKDKKKVLSLKSGKVVVKKGAKKGMYTIKLKASVKGTANYKAATTKTVTVKVVVK